MHGTLRLQENERRSCFGKWLYFQRWVFWFFLVCLFGWLVFLKIGLEKCSSERKLCRQSSQQFSFQGGEKHVLNLASAVPGYTKRGSLL